MKETIGERLKRIRKERGLTQLDVCNSIHITNQTLSKYEKGIISNIPYDKIVALSKTYNVSPEYIMGWTNSTNTIEDPYDYPNQSFYLYIPRGISAGAFEDVESVDEFEKVPIPDFMLGKYAKNKDLVLMHVNGESMNRVIANGAIIAVLTNLDKGSYKDGDIIIAINGGECTIKRFYNDYKNQMICLYPDSTDNSFHPILVPYDSEDFRIFGKVVIYSVVL